MTITTEVNGIKMSWDKNLGYLWNGKQTSDQRKIAKIKKALAKTYSQQKEVTK